MHFVRYPTGNAPVILPDTRNAPAWGAQLISASKRRCERDILAQAPDHKQRNAALGLLEQVEVDAIRAHIQACRTVQNALEAAVQAILDDGQLDNAAKLAALDALS